MSNVNDFIKQFQIVHLGSVDELILFAQYFRPHEYPEDIMNQLYKDMVLRLHQLGYDYEFGCCGKHKITKRNKS